MRRCGNRRSDGWEENDDGHNTSPLISNPCCGGDALVIRVSPPATTASTGTSTHRKAA